MHAGANPISGDFSLSAKGFAVRHGKRAEAVAQITVPWQAISIRSLAILKLSATT